MSREQTILIQFIGVLVGVVLFSVIAWVVLKVYAAKRPDSLLGEPHAVRDVWWTVNGGLLGIIIADIIVYSVRLTI